MAAAPSRLDHQMELVLDVSRGLGGPARHVTTSLGCRVTGINLTSEYVVAGAQLCEWAGLGKQISLERADALAMPFAAATFDAAYMLHVGMNIPDKEKLFAEVARVLRPNAPFAVYDVMRMGEGELNYLLPWATQAETNSMTAPARYRAALAAAERLAEMIETAT